MKEFLDYLCGIWNCWWDVRKGNVCLHFSKEVGFLLFILRKYKKDEDGICESIFYFEDISIEDFLTKYGGETVYVYYPQVGYVKIPDMLEWEIIKEIVK